MGQGYSMCSKETLMASIDNNSNMSIVTRLGAQAELKYKLFSSRGHLRSEFKGITCSDLDNLIKLATKEINTSLSFDPYHTFWLKVLQELQSMKDEFAPNVTSEGDGAVIPIPIPIPNPHAGGTVVSNSGEQNLRGLVNQSGYVSGYANGAIISFLDCKFSHK
ncbi:unnamed protein product [Sphenostylis stenocarpa]|uniref:Uncharacterized protein n=1 Tax=Sphenostylis stenocarpa TaxID=92480 RepID=A0AA86SSW8_9FABA|nr:unnamed protein product [Sphenostylis stenocarpa]